MNLHRGICALSLAICVAATSGVCFGQAAPKKKDIYSATADAHAEIKEALDKASTEHKRVIVVFGAKWCYDCHVLDAAFHRSDLAPIVAANYEVVHVDTRGHRKTRKEPGPDEAVRGSDEARHSGAGRA